VEEQLVLTKTLQDRQLKTTCNFYVTPVWHTSMTVITTIRANTVSIRYRKNSLTSLILSMWIPNRSRPFWVGEIQASLAWLREKESSQICCLKTMILLQMHNMWGLKRSLISSKNYIRQNNSLKRSHLLIFKWHSVISVRSKMMNRTTIMVVII
jgi:hypothetical protein